MRNHMAEAEGKKMYLLDIGGGFLGADYQFFPTKKTNIQGLTKPNFVRTCVNCAMNLHISGYLFFYWLIK